MRAALCLFRGYTRGCHRAPTPLNFCDVPRTDAILADGGHHSGGFPSIRVDTLWLHGFRPASADIFVGHGYQAVFAATFLSQGDCFVIGGKDWLVYNLPPWPKSEYRTSYEHTPKRMLLPRPVRPSLQGHQSSLSSTTSPVSDSSTFHRCCFSAGLRTRHRHSQRSECCAAGYQRALQITHLRMSRCHWTKARRLLDQWLSKAAGGCLAGQPADGIPIPAAE